MELKQNMNEIFSDGIADIIVSRGMVFLDFFHLVPSLEAPAERVSFLRITLPMSGLFGLIETSDNVVRHLVETGIFESNPLDASPYMKKDGAPAKKADKKSAKPAAKKAEAPAKPAAKPAPAKKAAPASKAPAKGKKAK